MKVGEFLKILGGMTSQEKISLLAEARTLSDAAAEREQRPLSPGPLS